MTLKSKGLHFNPFCVCSFAFCLEFIFEISKKGKRKWEERRKKKREKNKLGKLMNTFFLAVRKKDAEQMLR